MKTDTMAKIGITMYAQSKFGSIVFNKLAD